MLFGHSDQQKTEHEEEMHLLSKFPDSSLYLSFKTWKGQSSDCMGYQKTDRQTAHTWMILNG